MGSYSPDGEIQSLLIGIGWPVKKIRGLYGICLSFSNVIYNFIIIE